MAVDSRFWTICLFLVLLHNASAQRPYSVSWSNKTYGPDGPWYALSMSIGTPPQSVDLIPCRQGPSIPLGDYGVCTSSKQSGCSWATSGTYNYKRSSTVTPYTGSMVAKLEKDHEVIPGPINITGSTTYVLDTLRFNPPILSVENAGFEVLNNGFATGPSGSTYGVTLGGLSTGGPTLKQGLGYVADGDGSVNLGMQDTVIHQELYQKGLIPSPSWSMQIGSVAQGIPPSYVLGGYDSHRIVGQVIAQPIQSGLPIGVQITNIGLYNYSLTQDKAVPFAHGSDSGNLFDNSGQETALLPLALSLEQPHMTLPLETCRSLANHLPVHYFKSYSAYIWDTSTPAYKDIMASSTYLNFTLKTSRFTQAHTGIDILIPIQLLSLTLDTPITSTPKQYFPCSHATQSEGPLLGRAFLQATTLGYNWNVHGIKNNPQIGYWFLAQAPGPDLQPSSIQPITPNQDYINGFGADWAASWAKYWAAGAKRRPQPPSAPSASSSGGLSTSAQIGVGVGVAAALVLGLAAIACGVLRRRRRRGAQRLRSEEAAAAAAAAATVAQAKLGQESSVYAAGSPEELHADPMGARVELTPDGPARELSQNCEIREMASPANEVELPAFGRVELEG